MGVRKTADPLFPDSPKSTEQNPLDLSPAKPYSCHPRISSSILPNPPHCLSSWITSFTSCVPELLYSLSTYETRGNLRSLSLVYFLPVASAHLPPRAVASCFPITHANSKHFSGFPWFSPSFLANSQNPTSPLPPKFVQCCSETAKEQSAKLVHQLQKLEGDVTKKEEGKRRRRNRRRKNRRQRAEIYPLQKESEKGWVYV